MCVRLSRAGSRRYLRPALSTVSVDRERQGREAALRLLAVLRGETPAPVPGTGLHRIVVRGSTGPAPRDHQLG